MLVSSNPSFAQRVFEICKLILNFIWEYEEPQIAKTVFKNNKIEELYDIEICYKATEKKKAGWYKHKDR